mmetsp:Transcript_22491/g.49284  ORF Transcript_22491/g.49284 Transcript_22491/m.49284 type:complete len:245 (+) Transcript_22491:337-1071(+)
MPTSPNPTSTARTTFPTSQSDHPVHRGAEQRRTLASLGAPHSHRRCEARTQRHSPEAVGRRNAEQLRSRRVPGTGRGRPSRELLASTSEWQPGAGGQARIGHRRVPTPAATAASTSAEASALGSGEASCGRWAAGTHEVQDPAGCRDSVGSLHTDFATSTGDVDCAAAGFGTAISLPLAVEQDQPTPPPFAEDFGTFLHLWPAQCEARGGRTTPHTRLLHEPRGASPAADARRHPAQYQKARST